MFPIPTPTISLLSRQSRGSGDSRLCRKDNEVAIIMAGKRFLFVIIGRSRDNDKDTIVLLSLLLLVSAVIQGRGDKKAPFPFLPSMPPFTQSSLPRDEDNCQTCLQSLPLPIQSDVSQETGVPFISAERHQNDLKRMQVMEFTFNEGKE